MKYLPLILVPSILASTVSLLQARIDDDEIPIEYRIDRLWTVSIGARSSSASSKVKFGGAIGTIPSNRAAVADSSAGAVDRIYNDGVVGKDEARSEETLPTDMGNYAGKFEPAPPGRYRTFATTTNDSGAIIVDPDDDGNPVITGEGYIYSNALTRVWNYNNDSQISGASGAGSVDMHTYSATSDGQFTPEADGGSSLGIDLNLARRLYRFGSRVEVGLSLGVALNDISASVQERFSATLDTLTDTYTFTDPWDDAESGEANGKPNDFDTRTNAAEFTHSVDGTVFSAGTYEIITRINQLYTSRALTSTAGGADIFGNWQLKGAYLMSRVGPDLRVRLTERFAVTVSAGLAAAYVGTTFKFEETLTVPGVSSISTGGESDYHSDLILGYYGNANLEFWVTPRTGFYIGAMFESLGDGYTQRLAGRTATIDLGSGSGYRFGITTRF